MLGVAYVGRDEHKAVVRGVSAGNVQGHLTSLAHAGDAARVGGHETYLACGVDKELNLAELFGLACPSETAQPGRAIVAQSRA